jgi:phage shock protein C
MKKLRKTKERMIFGVCGALAAYFNVDVTLVRVAFVIGGLLAFSGVILYIILAFVIPEEEREYD